MHAVSTLRFLFAVLAAVSKVILVIGWKRSIGGRKDRIKEDDVVRSNSLRHRGCDEVLRQVCMHSLRFFFAVLAAFLHVIAASRTTARTSEVCLPWSSIADSWPRSCRMHTRRS